MQSMIHSHPLSPATVTQIINWAREAGQIALHYFKNTEPRVKVNQTLVTQADLEIEQFLTERIRNTFPQAGILGEEGYRSQNLGHQAAIWAIDPLDGTAAFSQGLPGWGISMGLLYEGQPVFGLFYMPLTDDLTVTSLSPSHSEPTVQPAWPPTGFLAVSASAHRLFQLDQIKGIRVLGSVGSSLIYTARGAATAALLPKARLWDLAAGAAIMNQAGGELRYLSGAPLDYLALLDGELASEPIIAGHPAVLADLQTTIWPIQEGC